MISWKTKIEKEVSQSLWVACESRGNYQATREDLDAALASLGLKAVPADAMVMGPNSSCAAAAPTEPKLAVWRYDIDGREIKVGDIVQPFAQSNNTDEYGGRWYAATVNNISHVFECELHKFSNRGLNLLPHLRIISR